MSIVRRAFVALLLVLAASAGPPPVHSAAAGPLPDTTGILVPWRIEPASPCATDSVRMIVRGFVATPCDSFLGAEALSPLFVRIRLQTYGDRDCFAAPSVFYPVPVMLGRFAPGQYAGIVEVELTTVFANGSPTTQQQQYRFEFGVDSCIAPPPNPPLPYVEAITTDPARACAGRPTALVLRGVFRDGCGRVIDAAVRDPWHVELTLKPDVLADTACTLALLPWTQRFDLGTLPAGPHRTDITLHVITRDTSGTGLVRSTYHGSHEFLVHGDCDSLPPPWPGPLPYVQTIWIRNDDACDPGPLCAGDSLVVHVEGIFPSDCFRFRRIQLIPSPLEIFPPPPPTVRVIVDDGGCLDRMCVNTPVPWVAMAKIPPQLVGNHRLNVELAQVTCSDSYPPGLLYGTSVPLVITDSCGVPPACLLAGFVPGDDACHATISKTRSAELTFTVQPGRALAGLQGAFRLDPPLLRITRLEAIGSAAGMLLNWSPTGDGARFVLFAASGAPIPPSTDPNGLPVLRLTVQSLARVDLPPVTRLHFDELLGSDILGNAVPYCPPSPCWRASDPRLVPGAALICAEAPCDFNADGDVDVRDLVRMVHCVNAEGECPPDAATRFDCDGDSTFALADVICCAHHVLLRPPCIGDDCPPARPEPAVRVSFEAPVPTAAGHDLPLRIAGIERIGGAVLALEAPVDRYEVLGFDTRSAGHWLTLHEVRDGRLSLGLLEVGGGPELPVPDDARFTLRLRLRPGEAPGGAVVVVGGEFSGRDGAALDVDLGTPRGELPGVAVALGSSQPNPFSSETRFTLQLVTAGEATVGIYDLRGRRLITLHRGPLPAGPTEFRWDGRDADGVAAPDGVYFYQAALGGRTLTRKLILVRRD